MRLVILLVVAIFLSSCYRINWIENQGRYVDYIANDSKLDPSEISMIYWPCTVNITDRACSDVPPIYCICAVTNTEFLVYQSDRRRQQSPDNSWLKLKMRVPYSEMCGIGWNDEALVAIPAIQILLDKNILLFSSVGKREATSNWPMSISESREDLYHFVLSKGVIPFTPECRVNVSPPPQQMPGFAY